MKYALLLGLSCVCAFAQDQIMVQNAASGFAGNLIALGSLVTVGIQPAFGQGLPPLDPASVQVTLTPPGGAALALPVLAQGSNQAAVIALVPKDAPLGPANVTLTYQTGTMLNGAAPPVYITTTSVPYPVTVAASSFGMFAPASNLTHPVHPGDYFTLWGTGLGNASADQVGVLLGGHPALVTYAGPAPGYSGLDQINFQAPQDSAIPDGCYVAVQVRAGTSASNIVTTSKSSGAGACQDPFGLTDGQKATLDAGGNIPVGQAGIYSMAGPAPAPATSGFTRTESAQVIFGIFNATNIAFLTQPLVAADVLYGCTTPQVSAVLIASLGVIDPGTSLLLTGPDQKQLTLQPQGPIHTLYTAAIAPPAQVSSPGQLPPPFFSPGTWQLGGPGSDTVKAFQTQLMVPPPVQVLSPAAGDQVSGQNGLTITWNGSDYSDGDLATVQVNMTLEWFAYATVCQAPATAGQIVIPAGLPSGNAVVEVLVRPGPGHDVTFPIPLTTGGTDPGLFRYNLSAVIPITIQ